MRIVAEKTKPILLLLGMSILTYGIIWSAEEIKTTNGYYNQDVSTQEEYIVDTTPTVQQTTTEGVNPEKFESENFTKQVLAASDSSSNSCKEALVNYQTQAVCEQTGKKDMNYENGDRGGDGYVRRDSSIVLSKVTIPLVLMSGSETVKDSNRRITKETPNIYKPAGEQFDEDIANVMLPPTKQISTERPWIVKKAFSSFYQLFFKQKADQPSSEGKLVVHNYLQNKCESVGNDSNVTPDKSNKISEFLIDTTRAPNEKATADTSKMVQACSGADKFIDIDKTEYTACQLNVVEKLLIKIKQQFSGGEWDACHETVDENGNTVPPEGDCMRIEDIVIKISSAFGSDEECLDGVCTNAYMLKRENLMLSPSDASKNKGKTYFTTPCMAIVEGAGEVEVKCAWDLSYLLRERKINEYDDIGSESTPSEDAYIKFLQEDSSKRDGQIPIEM